MAKKQKRSKRVSRGRRVGGVIPKKYEMDTMLALGVGLGMFAARSLPAVVNKMAPGANPKIVNVVQGIAGVIVANMSGKYPLIRGASVGIAGMAAVDLATNMGWLPGAEAVGAEEVVLSLGGAYGPGPTNYVAGGAVNGNFTNRTFASNVIAGNTMDLLGI